MELTITREVAFGLVEGAVQPQINAHNGQLSEPDFVTLERQRPDQAALTNMIRGYLEGRLKNCASRRKDHEAIAGLIEALQMSASLLTAQEVKEGEKGGPFSSTRSAFLSLAATLSGKTLPEPQTMRSEIMEVAHG